MNTRAEFYSDKFPACEKEEEEINPGRHGKRLAEFIAAGLKDRGVDVDNLIMEDWGVMVPIKNAPFPLWIGCGNCNDQPDKYLCFIEPHSIYVRRWFRKIDTRQQVARLHAALNDILSSEPSIRELKWTA
jgi:hypothetical protein